MEAGAPNAVLKSNTDEGGVAAAGEGKWGAAKGSEKSDPSTGGAEAEAGGVLLSKSKRLTCTGTGAAMVAAAGDAEELRVDGEGAAATGVDGLLLIDDAEASPLNIAYS